MKKSLYYLSGNIIWALIPYILLPFLTRQLSVADMGVVGLFTIIAQIFTIIIGVNAHAALQAHFNGLTHIERSQYISANGLFIAGIFGVLLLVLAGATPFIPIFESVGPQLWLWALTIGFAQFMVQYYLSLMQMLERAGVYVAMQMGQAVLNGLLSVLLVVFVVQNYVGRVLAMGLAVLVILILCMVYIHRQYGFTLQNGRAHIKKMLQFGLPLMPHSLAGIVIASLDRNLCAALLGLEETGFYTVALQVALGFSLLADGFNKAYTPFVYKKLHQQNVHNIVQSIWRYGGLWVLLIGVAIPITPYILPLIIGEKYQSAVILTQILTIGMGFGGLYYLFTNILFYYERTGLLSIITVGAGLLNIPMAYFMILQWGSMGAAVAFTLTQFFILIGVMFISHKYVNIFSLKPNKPVAE